MVGYPDQRGSKPKSEKGEKVMPPRKTSKKVRATKMTKKGLTLLMDMRTLGLLRLEV